MKRATHSPSLAMALAAGLLALSGCAKETGPDEQASASAPEVAPAVIAATADPAAAKPLASFTGKDADGDGKVTSAEYANSAQTMFHMMDADTGGTVTLQEMDAARNAIGTPHNTTSEQSIAKADSDGDGKLTLSEWMAAANAEFDRIDINKDGAIEQAEWNAAYPPETPAPPIAVKP